MLKHRVSNAGQHSAAVAAAKKANSAGASPGDIALNHAPGGPGQNYLNNVPGMPGMAGHTNVQLTTLTNVQGNYSGPVISSQQMSNSVQQGNPRQGQAFGNDTSCSGGYNNTVSQECISNTVGMQYGMANNNVQISASNVNCESNYVSREAVTMSGSANQTRVPMIVTTESTSREGVRILNERYDSVGNISPSPTKSLLGSPVSDSSYFSFNEIVMSGKFREGVTEQDLLQADTFYRSHKSEVFVCGCLANMYYGSVKNSVANDEWTFSATGIPLLLLDTGEHHRVRKLFIILAEKGTGFTLWRDVIDNLTLYKTPNANFHTMHLSSDHTKLVGLSFDDANKAREFYGHIEKLTADPDDDLLKVGGGLKKKKSMKDKKKKFKLPKKTEISQPCCFVHVTKLDRPVSESDLTRHTKGDSNVISKPFDFQHVTGTPGSGSDAHSLSGSLPNMLGSKLTLTSTSSVDSGLSDGRNYKRTSKS